jgi:hypothetical protein
MEVVKNKSFFIIKSYMIGKRRAHCCNYQYIEQGMNSCVNLESVEKQPLSQLLHMV